MENDQLKISNKLFLDSLKSKDSNIMDLDLKKFYENISKLHVMRTKRFNYKFDVSGFMYHSILSSTETYYNSNIFKFYESLRSIIVSLNISSYSSALTIGRSIIEHYAMLTYIGVKLEKFLNQKDYYEYNSLMLSMTIGPSQKTTLKKYKRIHVNDALKFIGESWAKNKKEKKKIKDMLLKVYGDISEYIHPVSPSIIMYEHQSLEQKKNDINPLDSTFHMKNSFSYNSESTQKTVFIYLQYVLNFTDSIISLLENFEINIIQKLKNQKETIIKESEIDMLNLPERLNKYFDFDEIKKLEKKKKKT